MKKLECDQTINYFTPDLVSVMTVDLNEQFKVETHDCYGGQVQDEHTSRWDIDRSIINLATGPIYINGLKAGDVVKLDIDNIELGSSGIMMTAKGLGVLGDTIQNESTKILSVEDGFVKFSERLCLPVKPMIGVIGLATKEDKIHTASPGCHGGNMDTTDITTGNSLYLPVFQDGGLLAMGDLHATMGDGELDGTGVEIDGEVTLTASKVEGLSILNPIVESPDAFFFIASAKTLDEAIKIASQNTVDHLTLVLKEDYEMAYRLLSACCDIRISQVVNPLVTVRVRVPKTLLPNLI
ncbi:MULTISPECIES: acetamidase/formamidase family protein [Jeotgalicoccus]|uniref:acetamidase/formamidase family protein n=1 Tax=Jeotgalicoccus TaxID=227979 RepID=UPI000412FCDE|nr:MULTISPECIES: acetamidase/formamidase family protein [Jeotgalicoccus]QQD84565.1 acetamidase/formamidase family protein [Jeotgalicoccus sp. ATCC 8456]